MTQALNLHNKTNIHNKQNNIMELTIENIYNKYQSKVLGIVNHMTYNKDKELAEEICQDVFVKVSENLHRYDEEKSKISTWIFNITKNTMIDYARKKSLQTISIQQQTDDNEREVMQVPSSDDLHENVVRQELTDRITNAIMRLPKTYRRLSELFFLKEYTHKELCEEMDLGLSCVKVKIMRSKELLQKELS